MVDYNTSGARTGLQTVLAAIGNESVNGIVKPLDIISLQEQSTNGADTQAVVNMLNAQYGAGIYAATTLLGGSTGAGTQTIVYNTQTVQLIGQALVGTANSSGQARQALRAEFRPIGYDSTADFYVYADHYKAGNTSSDAVRRNTEAVTIRADADALGAGKNIIYTGDFNIYKSSEAMYSTLGASGNGQAIDPINRPGNWSNSAAFLDIHTQSPVTTPRYSGQTTGGMDDRFDFQLVTAALMDSEGMSYIGGSYHAFGNTGTHVFNGEITSGSISALAARLPGYTTTQAQGVLDALTTASDHLPVVADYQVPAKMGVAVGAVPIRVMRDASVAVTVNVANTAAVVAANGADELDYVVSGSGGVHGSATGADSALGGSNQHVLTLGTTLVGAQTGQVNVVSSSQSVANGTFSQTVSYSVLDHAKPFFAEVGQAVGTMTIDFGQVSLAGGPISMTFHLANWTSSLGLTAGLDFDQMLASGDFSEFSTNLALFSDLTAGNAAAFLATFDPDQLGAFQANYQLSFSDEDVPGATSLGTLNLVVKGVAVPEPNALFLMMGSGAVVGFLVRRKR